MPTRARSGLSLIALPVPASHPVAAALSRLGSPGSARNRLAVLKRAAGLLSGRTRDVWSLPWADVRYAHLLALRAALQSLRLSASSINGTIVAVQAVCIECWRAGALSGDALQRLRDVPRVRASRLAAGRMLSLPELRRLADRARREGLHGARMLAAFALLMSCAFASAYRRRLRAATLALTGAIATLFFDLVTNLATGVLLGQVRLTLLGGIPFSLWHVGTNVALFAAIGTPLVGALSHYRLRLSSLG